MKRKLCIWIFLLLTVCGRLAAQAIPYPEEPLPRRLDRIAEKYSVHISYDRFLLRKLVAPKADKPYATVVPLLRQSLEYTGFTFRKSSSRQYYIIPIPGGTVAGIVMDAENGDPLSGVSITINNIKYESSAKGTFDIPLESGTYSMVISAVGYETKQIPIVRAQAGRALTANITLKKRAIELPPVIVVSSLATESVQAFYARQKNAETVTDGLSAEQIETLPDKTLSQIVKRINGVNITGNTIGIRGQSERYSQLLVDGIVMPSLGLNKRSLVLDLFPKEIINEIVLTKTAAADASPEFSGGQLNIRTLDIPHKTFTSAYIGTGGNTQSLFKTFEWLGKKGKLDFLGVDDGTRSQPDFTPATAQKNNIPVAGLIPSLGLSLPDWNAGFSLGRAYTLNNKATLGFVLGTSLYSQQALVRFNTRRSNGIGIIGIPTVSIPLGEGTEFRFLSGTGTVLNAGYKKGSLTVSVRNFITTQLKDDYSLAYRNYFNQGTYRNVKELLQEPEKYFMQQHRFDVEKSLTRTAKFHYFFAFTNGIQKLLDRRYLQYFRTLDDKGNAIYNMPNILYSLGQDNDSNVVDNRAWMDIKEKSYTTGVSFAKDIYQSDPISIFVKSGWTGIFRQGSFSSLRFLPYTDENTIVTSQYPQLLDPAGNSTVYYRADKRNGNIYSGNANTQALYLLTDQKFYTHIRLSYGLRAEYYDMQNDQHLFLKRLNNGFLPSQYGNGITGEKNWYWLPSANLIFNTGGKTNLRAAYFKTVLHPSFRELSYFSLYEPEMNGSIDGRQLATTKIDNYDLRWEWYPTMQENISVSLFYKKLLHPVELVQRAAYPTAYGYINQNAARTTGLEIEARKSLGFLAPQSILQHLTLQGNYTVNRSKVEVMGFPMLSNGAFLQTRLPNQDRPLFNQAPWTFNTALLYDNTKTGVFVFYNRNGPKTYISNIDPNLIEYENGVDQMDMSLYVKCFKNKGRIMFNVLNLLDPWHIYYTNTTGYKQVNGNYWKLVNGTVRYNSKDGDIITYKNKQGISINAGITLFF